MNRVSRLVAPLVAALLVVLVAGCSAAAGGGGDTTPPAAATGVMTILADTVYGSKNVPPDKAKAQTCVLASRFPHNSEIVWRARVMDPASGQGLDDKSLTKVEVKLADGQTLPMHYAAHPKDNPVDYFWSASFDIPADYPTGTLDYEIVATGKDGATASFKPFPVAPSLVTVTDETVPVISTAS
jgi:hypothetical protein